MASTERKLSPRQAVDTAFEQISGLFPKKVLNRLLLEELRYEEKRNLWEVTIGFDVEPKKQAHKQFPFLNVSDSNELIREFRVIRLKADDGKFVELGKIRSGSA